MARAGAARVFFDIVGTFQANKLIKDTSTAATVQQAIMADAAANIADSFDEMATAVLDAVGEITDAFYEYEAQLIRVRKFYQGAPEEIDRFAASARELGLQFGFTAEQALSAAARTAQLKNVLKSQEAIIEATRGGLLMAAVGEMEVEMGMNRLINLAQQTGFMMGNLTKAQYEQLGAEQQANLVRGNTLRVLDQLNTVENTSVAVMEDITFVLNQFASQAHIAGESIGEMAAMSALLLETGEEVSRAGTGLRMIYQRIGNENTAAVKELQKLMGGVDAATVTQMKLTDIITEIGPAYAEMTAVQKRNLAVSIAGSRHYIKFLKLMENQPRLLELQADAYIGTYDAITEFQNRTESAVFDMEQLQAAIVNLQVDLGEKLAPAYLNATEHTWQFYNAVNKLAETDMGLNTMENVIQLSGLYQNLVRPFADVGFQVFNMFIAFKTLAAVQKMMSMQAHNQKNAYMALANEIQFVSQVNNKMSANWTKNSAMMITSNSNWGNQIDITKNKLHNLRAVNKQLTVSHYDHKFSVDAMNTSLQRNNAPVKVFKMNLKDKNKWVRNTTAGMKEHTHMMAFFETKLLETGVALKTTGHDLAMYQRLNAQATIGTGTFNALQDTGVQGLMRRNTAMTTALEARRNEHALMQGELSVLVPLTGAEQKEHMIKLSMNNTMINQNRIKLGIIRSDIMRMKLSGVEIPKALLKEQASLESMNAELMENNILIEGSVIASKQAEQAITDLDLKTKRLNMTFLQKQQADMKVAFSSMTLAGALKSVQASLMPMAMILPFLVDSEKQMSMMMSAMLIPMLWKSTAAFMANNAQKSTSIVLTGMLTGGLSLVAAGLALVAGMLLIDALVGDKFLASPLDNLNDFNDGLNTMESRLAGIMSSDEGILAGVIDESMAELGALPDGLMNAKRDLEARFKTLTLAQGGLETDSVLFGDIEHDKDATQAAIDNIDATMDAKRRLASLNDKLSGGYSGIDAYQMGTGTTEYGLDFSRAGIGSKGIDIKLWESEFDAWTVTYSDMQGNILHEQFENQSDANTRKVELEQMYGDDVLRAQRDYLAALFGNQEDANAIAADQLQAANEEAMGEMFGFANAREELFFGQRQNFTGALYKQVAQGGIENLLHKTEIIQTNVFNGMTLPEMVSQVADGVRTELRNSGLVV